MIRVVLADDETMMRAGVRAIVTADSGITVVGEAADGLAAVDLVARHRPDVALLDIRMPAMDGLAAARRLRDDSPDTAVVMLTLFGEDSAIAAAIDAGVHGFVLKTGEPDELITAVRAAAEGAAFLSPQVARRVIDQFGDHPNARARAARERIDALSDRERDVLALVGDGLTNAQIAGRLTLSQHTVKTHLDSVRTRLGVANRVQAALIAHEAGLPQRSRFLDEPPP